MQNQDSTTVVTSATDLIGTGLSDYEIARRTGASRSSVQRWRIQGPPHRERATQFASWRPPAAGPYSYLFGIYLGDGYVSKAAHSPVLEISLDARYPGIAMECQAAIERVADTGARIYRRTGDQRGFIRLTAGSSLWPFAFPQHGPGKKHERQIVLASWQQRIVDLHPQQFIRGLLHSDGSRCVNRFNVDLSSGSRQYAYVRYFFTNRSIDIQRLFSASCDRLGIRWTRSSSKSISVAERRSVALLDSFVGPKSDAGGGI